MKSDIESALDIQRLIDSFYDSVKIDAVIGYIFSEVAAVNWEQHLPVMYAFWESLLLGSNTYEGNPMVKHIQLNKQTPLDKTHFDRWLSLFVQTVDEHFEGKKAEEAKTRAANIAHLMLYKIQSA